MEKRTPMKTCLDYVKQHIRTEPVDTLNTIRYGRDGWFTFKPEWDSNVAYWGPLILRVMQKHLNKEWKLYGNKSVTSSHRLID